MTEIVVVIVTEFGVVNQIETFLFEKPPSSAVSHGRYPLMVVPTLRLAEVVEMPIIFGAAVETISPAAMDLKVGCAATPETGPAQNLFAIWVAVVIAKVPEFVIGEPVTENSEGTVRPTEVTEDPSEAEVIRPCASTVMFAFV